MPNEAPDTAEWLTYREAAARLGISRDALAMRARRLDWPRRAGNKPSDPVRIQIPPDAIHATHAAAAHQVDAITELVDTLQHLRAMLDAERAERVHAQSQLEELRQDTYQQLAQLRLQLGEARLAAATAHVAEATAVGLQQRVDKLVEDLTRARRRWWHRFQR